MPIPERLEQYIETTKQRSFPKDFLEGWQNYEVWDQATVGASATGQRSFRIAQEDVVAYNKACGETDPLMIDPEYAATHSPTGEVLQHPIFVTTIAFYSLGEQGIGTWIRTPGARNPYQRIEILEPFKSGEVIVTTVTTDSKYLQRGKAYLQMKLEFHNEIGTLKARWSCSLILPPTRADVARFANA
jgi:acyl dehydratase